MDPAAGIAINGTTAYFGFVKMDPAAGIAINGTTAYVRKPIQSRNPISTLFEKMKRVKKKFKLGIFSVGYNVVQQTQVSGLTKTNGSLVAEGSKPEEGSSIAGASEANAKEY
ncbi:hypothetical protein V6N11_079685 [Hibiscus sabdariffa]|uniref:Uncharacterized protein n=1 Tax=Hibiscus sabdariffa TaxID=183260 RepID=A0ABR2RW79_9ROSI